MRTLASVSLLSCLINLVTSCTDSKKSYALKWSKEIKEKIAKETNTSPDSTHIDSISGITRISTFKKGVLLKEVGIDSITKDTFWIKLLSSNQKFSWVKEFCPMQGLNEEFIGYGNSAEHHSLIGLHEVKYCNGNLRRRGFELKYGSYAGVWEEYDRSGKLLKRTDYGNMDKLDSVLHALKN